MTGYPRTNIRDLWNARLVRGASWTAKGNPVVVTTMKVAPGAVIDYRSARRIHRKCMAAHNYDYHVDALVHTYTDDQNFDGVRTGIWADSDSFIEMAHHFAGACVDFSTYADMPEPIMRFQVYRMRSIEYGLAKEGVPVIVNARWAGSETWCYTIDELPEHTMLAIGTVASGLKRLENRPVFESGLRRILDMKRPTCLVVIGSTSNRAFDEAREQGVRIVQFDSKTNAAFKTKTGEAHV